MSAKPTGNSIDCCAQVRASSSRRWCWMPTRTADAPAVAVRRIGPALLFERLWQETGGQSVIAALARGRGHRFALALSKMAANPHISQWIGASGFSKNRRKFFCEKDFC